MKNHHREKGTAGLRAWALATVAAGCACGPFGGGSSGGSEERPDSGHRPPLACRTPGPLPGGAWFSDITADVGLETPPPPAGGAVSADVDGDGWADLFTVHGSSDRGKPDSGPSAGQYSRHLLLNRADPRQPARRVFVDVTEESGILATRDGAGERGFNLVKVADLDNDGHVDLVLCSADQVSATHVPLDGCDAFLNDGAAHFTLAPASALNESVTWVPSGAFLDYDHDGVLDFWPATIAHWPYDPAGPNRQRPTLFRGAGGGTFTNVSTDVGLPTRDGSLAANTQWRSVFGVTACDLDGDGFDDILNAAYGREESWAWLNVGGASFAEAGHALGLDHDDRTDVTDDQSYRCYCQANPSRCPSGVPAPTVQAFCGAFGGAHGRGWQPGYSDQPYALGGNTFAMACGDIDDDGDMDVMTATIVHGDVGSSSDPSELVLNPGNGGKWTRPGNDTNGLERPESGIFWNHGDSMVVFVDVDLDGLKDIFLTTTGAYGLVDRPRLWHQQPGRQFLELGIPAGLATRNAGPNLQGPAFIDVDGDGDLDLVAGDTDQGRLHVYRNDIGQDRNVLRVRLAGRGLGASNASAIGAVVRVTTGTHVQTQVVSGGYGIGNVQADFALTFGLGESCSVDRLEIRWPDAAGTVTSFNDVVPNHEVLVREGAAAPEYVRALGPG